MPAPIKSSDRARTMTMRPYRQESKLIDIGAFCENAAGQNSFPLSNSMRPPTAGVPITTATRKSDEPETSTDTWNA